MSPRIARDGSSVRSLPGRFRLSRRGKAAIAKAVLALLVVFAATTSGRATFPGANGKVAFSNSAGGFHRWCCLT